MKSRYVNRDVLTNLVTVLTFYDSIKVNLNKNGYSIQESSKIANREVRKRIKNGQI